MLSRGSLTSRRIYPQFHTNGEDNNEGLSNYKLHDLLSPPSWKPRNDNWLKGYKNGTEYYQRGSRYAHVTRDLMHDHRLEDIGKHYLQ